MKLKNIGLYARITAGVLAVVVLGTLVWVNRENDRLHLAYLNERRADLDVALQVENVRLKQSIETLRQDVVFLANTPPVSGLIRATANHGFDARDNNPYERWEARLQEIFAAFLRTHPDYFQVRYIGVANGGRELVRVDRNGSGIEVITRVGLQAKGERDYFKAGLSRKAGEVFLSEFTLNQEHGKNEQPQRPTLRAVTPVFDMNGTPFGVIVINKDVRPLFASVKGGLPDGVQAYIADYHGNYLFHPDAGHAFAFETGGSHGTIIDDFPLLKPLFETQGSDLLPLTSVSADTETDHLAAKRVSFDETDPSHFLLLAYHLPADIIKVQSKGLSLPSLLDVLLAMVLVGGISALVVRRAFFPLRRITAAAREISAGRREIRLAEQGGEIGELADALNTMLEKLSGNELIEQENTFRKELIDALPGVFYMIDRHGRFLMWNRNFERVSQRDAEELGRISPLDLFLGEDKSRIETAIRAVFETGEVSVEADMVTKDGVRIPYHFTGRRIAREGEPVLVGLGLDITEQHENVRITENLLRRNQSLMLNSMEGIHVMDTGGNVLDVNDTFCKMLGYTREEALRLNVRDWDGKFSAEELRAQFPQLIGHNGMIETVHRRKDGSLLNVEICINGVEIDGKGYLYAASRDITERKRAEHVLADSERKFHALYDSMTEGVALHELLLDESGKPADYILLDINAAYEAITGLRRQDVVGRRASELYGTGEPPYLELYAGVALTGYSSHFDTRFEPMGIDFSISVFSPAKNQFATVFADVTERKTAETALRSYKQVIETTADGFWVTDMQGRLLEANRAYADISGYTVQELQGMHISQLEATEKPEDTRAHIDKIMREGSDRFETKHRRKDGVVLDIEVVVTRMQEEKKLFVFSRDISERKRAEQELRIAAAAFETHDAILITDVNSNIVRVNKAFTEITGYSAEEVLGKNPRMMSSGRQDKEFYAAMWQQISRTGSWAGEIWDRRKNGDIYPKWLTITAVKDGAGVVTQYVAIFSDITARKMAEEEIRNLAFYDALTQLPNRRLFQDRLYAALQASARHDDHGALLFIDLDRFKLLNDTLGHDYGDLLLVEVAQRIKSCVREIDTVARLGGDEFVVLLEGTGTDREDASRKAGLVAEKIREALARAYVLKGHEHYSSPSIGISLFHDGEETMDELVKHADAAMYQAKNAGRNTVRFYDPSLQKDLETRATLENDLRRAIDNHELQLYYQIQVDRQHRPVGAEGLLRWIHPQRGMVSPAQFIPVAEDSSLILEIGDWVLETVCTQLAVWDSDARMRQLTLAMNVSANQFRMHGFVEQVTAMLRKHGVEPGRLKLELTEGVVLNDIDDVTAKMSALRTLGVKLSLDDFGTGYSSLSYLKRLPLDQLKIDQSFVRDIASDPGDAGMVRSIIDMAKNFKHEVIAEGVETEAQLVFLEQNGCMVYQGYFFGKPVPLVQFEAQVRERS